MKVGLAKVVITPPVGTSLIGYFNDRRSTGIMDDLYAIACVFDDGVEKAAVVTCDMVHVGESTVKKVGAIIEQRLGIPSGNILVHGTHTHTGPPAEPPSETVYDKGYYVEKAWLELLPYLIAGSVTAAWEKREEARIGFGKTALQGVAFNRRYYLKDGMVVTNPFAESKQIVKTAGPADPSAGVMKIENRRGRLLGVLVNWACHPDTIGGTLISADWPGAVRQELETAHPGAVALFLNGPSGDINHVNPVTFKKRTTDTQKLIGKRLSANIGKILPAIKTTGGLSLGVQNRKFNIPYHETPAEEVRAAKKYLASRKDAGKTLRGIIFRSLLLIAAEKRLHKTIPVQIVGISIGKEFALLGMPGELFTGIGLTVKERSPFAHTWIAQNSQQILAYIPSTQAFAQHDFNRSLQPEYNEANLEEAIGMKCSYETTPLCCKVGRTAPVLMEQKGVALLAALGSLKSGRKR